MTLPLPEAILRLRDNELRLDRLTNGTDTETWTTTGAVPVPSIRKFLADKDAQINTGGASILALSTAQAAAASSSATAAAGSSSSAGSSATAAAGSATAAAGSATAAAASAASAAASASFATRTLAAAATIPGGTVFVLTSSYAAIGDGGGTIYKVAAVQSAGLGKFQSADGRWWEPGVYALNPAIFGAPATGDASTGVQAMLDFVRASWDVTIFNFQYIADFGGRMWTVNSSINLTALRQPGIMLRNGGLYGKCTGKIILDLAGTNSPMIEDFLVVGDGTNVPAVGILLSRAKISGTIVGVPNARLSNVRGDGYFSKSAFINLGAEVTSEKQCFWSNKSRSLTAYSYIMVSHAGTLDTYVGGLTSDYATLPVSADGTMSCIDHWLDQIHAERFADAGGNITGISKANPAVVSMLSADLIASGIANGDKLWFTGIAGMTQLNGTVQTVAGINTGAGTFQLSGTDSTGYSTFTSGYLRNQTGPAVLLNGCGAVHGRAGYILTYGNPGIVFDMTQGDVPRMVDLEWQPEADQPVAVRFDLPSSGAKTAMALRFHLLNNYQTIRDAVIDVVTSSTGTLTITDLDFAIAYLATAPASGLFRGEANLTLANARISTPLSTSVDAIQGFAGFSGEVRIVDGASPAAMVGAYDFQQNGVSGRPVRIINNDPGAQSGPLFDMVRQSSSPANNDFLGYLRWVGNNSAAAAAFFAGFRAKILDVTAGSEDARIEVMQAINGVESATHMFQGGQFIFATTYTVANLPGSQAGGLAYASNGRKNGEGAAAGTGVLCFYDSTGAWKACDTGATVAA